MALRFLPVGGRVMLSMPDISLGGGNAARYNYQVSETDFFGDLISMAVPEPTYGSEAASNGVGSQRNIRYDLEPMEAVITLRESHPALRGYQLRPGFKAVYEGELAPEGIAGAQTAQVREVHYISGKITNSPTGVGDEGGARPVTVNVEVSEYAILNHLPDGVGAAGELVGNPAPDAGKIGVRTLVPVRYINTNPPNDNAKLSKTTSVDYLGGTPIQYGASTSVFAHMLEPFQTALKGNDTINPLHHSVHARFGYLIDMSD